MRKATQAEQLDYENAVHPLYGYINARVNHRRGRRVQCVIEYLGEGKDEPNYEVLAPSGYIFSPDGVHSLLCVTLADVRQRVADSYLTDDESEAA